MSNVGKLENHPPMYISEKDASIRYSLSRSWFQRARWAGRGPSFIKVNGGKVLYPLQAADQWFKQFCLRNSTSEKVEEI